MVLAQLVERSLPIPEIRGSNPVIGKNLFKNWTFVNCQLCIEKDENKEKEAGNGPFFKNGAKIGAKNWLKMAPNNWNPRSEYYGQRLYEAGLAQTSKKRILRRLFHLLPRYCLRLLLLVLLLILVQVPGSKVQLMDVCIFPSQRILTIGGSITVWLTPCLTGLDAT